MAAAAGERAEAPEEASEETWARRAAARQRQIDIGKARPEYQQYLVKTPVALREDGDPGTPDPNARISKRQFDRNLSLWRRQLHAEVLQADVGAEVGTPLAGRTLGRNVIRQSSSKATADDLSPATESTCADSDAATCGGSGSPGVEERFVQEAANIQQPRSLHLADLLQLPPSQQYRQADCQNLLVAGPASCGAHPHRAQHPPLVSLAPRPPLTPHTPQRISWVQAGSPVQPAVPSQHGGVTVPLALPFVPAMGSPNAWQAAAHPSPVLGTPERSHEGRGVCDALGSSVASATVRSQQPMLNPGSPVKPAQGAGAHTAHREVTPPAKSKSLTPEHGGLNSTPPVSGGERAWENMATPSPVSWQAQCSADQLAAAPPLPHGPAPPLQAQFVAPGLVVIPGHSTPMRRPAGFLQATPVQLHLSAGQAVAPMALSPGAPFHFQSRPAPHIVTPARSPPNLPMNSPNQRHSGLTPGPKPQPDAQGVPEGRVAGYSAACLRQWSHEQAPSARRP